MTGESLLSLLELKESLSEIYFTGTTYCIDRFLLFCNDFAEFTDFVLAISIDFILIGDRITLFAAFLYGEATAAGLDAFRI